MVFVPTIYIPAMHMKCLVWIKTGKVVHDQMVFSMASTLKCRENDFGGMERIFSTSITSD